MPSYSLQSVDNEAFKNGVQRTDVDLITIARSTLDEYYREMMGFNDTDLGDIMAHLAAYSAYASELRGRIQREESRRLQSFRTKELDPFLEEVDRQFKIWSRCQAIRNMEWDISKGGM